MGPCLQRCSRDVFIYVSFKSLWSTSANDATTGINIQMKDQVGFEIAAQFIEKVNTMMGPGELLNKILHKMQFGRRVMLFWRSLTCFESTLRGLHHGMIL